MSVISQRIGTNYQSCSNVNLKTPKALFPQNIELAQSNPVTFSSDLLKTNSLNFVPFTGAKSGLSKIDVDISAAIMGMPVDEAFKQNEARLSQAVNRLYQDVKAPGQWLKWITLPERQLPQVQAIQNYVDHQVRNKFDDVVVLGIGGSSLGAKALINSLANTQWNSLSKEQRQGLPRIHFIENIDPDSFAETLNNLDLSKTLINVVSKSGTTPETSATFLNLQERMISTVGKDKAKDHIVAITDKDPAKSVLKQVCVDEGYKTFLVPDDVGGRYSVLSDVGLLPAAFAGIDIAELLRGAHDMAKACQNVTDLRKNPAASQALVAYLNYNQGRDYSVMMPYADKLNLISDWYAQLWGESLGKKQDQNGNTINLNHSPIKALGAVDQHSQLQLWREGKDDKVYTFLTVNKFNNEVPITRDPTFIPDKLDYMRHNSLNDLIKCEAEATQEVLIKDGKPVVNVKIPQVDAYHIGQILQMYMTETAIVGELQNLGVHTFLQPAVEDGKIITKDKMRAISAQKTT